jgi:hypothetical protein
MKSALVASRSLAWIAIVISDAYLGLVLLFTAILSDGEILGRERMHFNLELAVAKYLAMPPGESLQ